MGGGWEGGGRGMGGGWEGGPLIERNNLFSKSKKGSVCVSPLQTPLNVQYQ